jgi:integrase/recombinase XerD
MSSNITYNVELNHKPQKDGTYVIFIRITHNRKHSRIKTDVFLQKRTDFNPKAKFGHWVRASEPRNSDYNRTLSDRIHYYQDKHSELLTKGQVPTREEFVAIITKPTSISFIQFYKAEITRYADMGKYRTSNKHKFILDKLEEFLKSVLHREGLSFTELNNPFLSKYETYLLNIKGNHINTVYTDLKSIRTIYRNAIRQDIVEQSSYPFFKYSLRQVPTVKDKLSIKEFESIKKLMLTPASKIWHAKNYFLFSYYCNGMRFGDICTLKWYNIKEDNRITYIMSKNDKVVSLKLQDQARTILHYYKKENTQDTDFIFPLLKNEVDYTNKKVLKDAISSNNTLTNKELKAIASQAKIRTKLTFHISRHSFAYHLYLNTKDVKKVQDALYHSSLKETQTYLKELGVTDLDSTLDNFYSQ